MSTVDWTYLGGQIEGEVVLPDSPVYKQRSRAAIARFDHIRPSAVALCAAPNDVAAAIAFANKAKLPMAIRSGGHSFAGHSSTDGIVIDVTPMSTITVAEGVARVGAGARLAAVYDALHEQGLAIPAGCGPTVGIAGLTLGGGLGILGRAHGLTCDRLIGAQVVLADGRIADCDEHEHGDLFWALRGAGSGNFGVVTSLTFEPVPEPDATAFCIRWPLHAATRVIDEWQRWAPDAADEIAASLLVHVESANAADSFTQVMGAVLATEVAGADIIADLVSRVGAEPSTNQRCHGSHRQAKAWLATIGESGAESDTAAGQRQRHEFSKSQFFAQSLPPEAIAALVGALDDVPRPGLARELDFTPMGGAYNRTRADTTAFVHRSDRFLLKHAAAVDAGAPADLRRAATDCLTTSHATAHAHATGRAYQNFPDPDLDGWAHAYYGTNLPRLVDVKRAYDPENAFRFAQSLPLIG